MDEMIGLGFVKKQEEVGDDLSVCMLNILSKVSSLPRLGRDINFSLKQRYKFFKQSCDLMLVT